MTEKLSIFRTGLGQDSGRFLPEDSSKPCLIGGVIFEEVPGLRSESDGDVVHYAICNAISSLTGVQIVNTIVQDLCSKDGITDSQAYVERALLLLGKQKISHISISLEGKKPLFSPKIEEMRKKIAKTLKIQPSQVGITAIGGDGLTDFGCGDGVQCFTIISTMET